MVYLFALWVCDDVSIAWINGANEINLVFIISFIDASRNHRVIWPKYIPDVCLRVIVDYMPMYNNCTSCSSHLPCMTITHYIPKKESIIKREIQSHAICNVVDCLRAIACCSIAIPSNLEVNTIKKEENNDNCDYNLSRNSIWVRQPHSST